MCDTDTDRFREGSSFSSRVFVFELGLRSSVFVFGVFVFDTT